MKISDARECDGIIRQFGRWGWVSTWRIRVEYQVDGKTYEVIETVKMKSEFIKLGPIPIGQRKAPRLPTTEVGRNAVVCYDPENPRRAYLRDNKGWMTSD